jgi:hypothetical protein
LRHALFREPGGDDHHRVVLAIQEQIAESPAIRVERRRAQQLDARRRGKRAAGEAAGLVAEGLGVGNVVRQMLRFWGVDPDDPHILAVVRLPMDEHRVAVVDLDALRIHRHPHPRLPRLWL